MTISMQLFAAEIEQTTDEDFFLFIADMPQDEQTLDPLSMLAFEPDIELTEEDLEQSGDPIDQDLNPNPTQDNLNNPAARETPLNNIELNKANLIGEQKP